MHPLLQLLEVKIYQSSWNNISLTEIAEELHLGLDEVAARHFYEAFYRKLKALDFAVDQEWLRIKSKSTAWLQDLCDQAGLSPGSGKAISLGAGLGIVELPLLECGYNIELQECQPASLEYIRNKGVAFIERITTDFGALPSNNYDAIYAGSLSYVLDMDQYASFFEHCFRMLKPGGKLMLWEPECFLPPVYWLIRVRNVVQRKHRGVFWGWLRSAIVHQALARKAGFDVLERTHFDKNYDAVSAPFKLLGCTVPYSKSFIQRYIFRKPQFIV